MKKIQITTAPIKADAQVIVLNASFVARITKAHVELRSAIKAINEAANCAIMYGQCIKDDKDNTTIGVTDMRFMFSDLNRINRTMDLINDIYFAMVEDEDGTTDVDKNDDLPRGIILPQPARPQGLDTVD